MAEETQKTTDQVVPTTTTTETVTENPPPAEPVIATSSDKDTPPPPAEENPEKPVATEEVVAETKTEAEKPNTAAADNKISQSESFKEETNVVAELPDPQKKALDELKQLIQDALNKHEFTVPPKSPEVTPPEEKKPEEEKKDEKEEEKKVEKEATEEKTGSTSEEPKPEAEVPKPEADVPKPEAEVPKPEAEVPKESEEKKVETVVEVVEKIASSADEDGAKTVEAIQESIVSVTGTEPEAEAEPKVEEPVAYVAPTTPEEVEIWGIPLLADERSDAILLKFLRARDFKVKESFTMIKNTVIWRKEFGIEALIEEDLGNDWDKVVFTDGYDKEGHTVCYNVFGEFEDKDLYQKTFSDEEKRNKFIRWRIQSLEKSVRKLDFSPTGISTIVQVNDLKNSPGLGKRELRQATNQALQLLQDNYPEFVAKQIFINVPWWYLAFSRMLSAFLTQRTKSKFVFAGPSKSADTLFKYIAPEQVPVQYGGLSREGEQEFTTADPATEVTIKPATKHTVEFPVTEKSTLVWEVRVVGWDVSYGAEFVPSAEDGYTVILQKNRKIAPADETVISNSFKVGDAGKVVLTIDNQSSKKKKLLYRSKAKPISE